MLVLHALTNSGNNRVWAGCNKSNLFIRLCVLSVAETVAVVLQETEWSVPGLHEAASEGSMQRDIHGHI